MRGEIQSDQSAAVRELSDLSGGSSLFIDGKKIESAFVSEETSDESEDSTIQYRREITMEPIKKNIGPDTPFKVGDKTYRYVTSDQSESVWQIIIAR